MQDWLHVQTFDNSLEPGGTLMKKNPAEAYELLKEMASNTNQWLTERATPRKCKY